MTDGPTLAETRAFFAQRAHGWDERFPDDGPAYERAVADLAARPGGVVLDVGCGTGRALPSLARGPGGARLAVGLDVTAEMLAVARPAADQAAAALVLGDASHLPFPPAAFDAVFAAGFLPHLADPEAGLAELARVTRAGGRLALFHAIGRRVLAARHGDVPASNDIRAEAQLTPALVRSGWLLESIDDAEDRYLALAVRSA
ncbi:MAG: class I SAM-dependent methyltransferase [Acidimicrobiales bacterium]